MAGQREGRRPEETELSLFFSWEVEEVRCGHGLFLHLSDLSAFSPIPDSGPLVLRAVRTGATRMLEPL